MYEVTKHVLQHYYDVAKRIYKRLLADNSNEMTVYFDGQSSYSLYKSTVTNFPEFNPLTAIVQVI